MVKPRQKTVGQLYVNNSLISESAMVLVQMAKMSDCPGVRISAMHGENYYDVMARH